MSDEEGFMGEEEDPGRKDWLEVEGGPGAGNKTVYCPQKDRDMPLHQCLACKRYHTLALDPTGKHIQLVCDWKEPEADPAAKPAPEGEPPAK